MTKTKSSLSVRKKVQDLLEESGVVVARSSYTHKDCNVCESRIVGGCLKIHVLFQSYDSVVTLSTTSQDFPNPPYVYVCRKCLLEFTNHYLCNFNCDKLTRNKNDSQASNRKQNTRVARSDF